jgi:hypothetical protein
MRSVCLYVYASTISLPIQIGLHFKSYEWTIPKEHLEAKDRSSEWSRTGSALTETPPA